VGTRPVAPAACRGGTAMAESRHAALVLGALGDFLLTLPLLCELRRNGPVAILSRGHYRALLPPGLAQEPFADTDSATGALLFAESAALPAALAGLLHGATVQAFMHEDVRLASSLRRAGVAGVVWHDPRPSQPPHIVMRFFTAAGRLPPAALLDTPVMPRATPAGDTLWLHPGSGSMAKSLAPTALVEFARRGLDRGLARLVVSFGEADLALREPVRQAFAQHRLAFTEVVCPDLGELRHRLAAEAAAFVGPDTGVTHLAAALGIPTTAIFRATDPAVWRPVGNVCVLDQRPAAPSGQRRGPAGGSRLRCGGFSAERTEMMGPAAGLSGGRRGLRRDP